MGQNDCGRGYFPTLSCLPRQQSTNINMEEELKEGVKETSTQYLMELQIIKL